VACSTAAGANMLFEIRLPRPRLCRNTFGGDLIRARIVSCRRARQVVRSWGRRYQRDGRASRRVWEYSSSASAFMAQLRVGALERVLPALGLDSTDRTGRHPDS
jgi:hypothetical protein